jgi:hypothetical protein
MRSRPFNLSNQSKRKCHSPTWGVVVALAEALVGRFTVIAALTTSAVNATSSRSYLNSRAIASGVARRAISMTYLL